MALIALLGVAIGDPQDSEISNLKFEILNKFQITNLKAQVTITGNQSLVTNLKAQVTSHQSPY
jgi:hypothetical protein